MVKKRKKFFISSLLLFSLVLVGGVSFFIYKQQNKKNFLKKEKVLLEISGAVSYQGGLFFDKGVKLRDVLFKFNLKPNADIKKINLEEKIIENKKIFIPFIDYKTKKKINKVTEEEFKKVGIRMNIIKKIILFLKDKDTEKLKWEDFLKINGLGEKTLKILQEEFEI
ncbi:MAG0490 family ComEA-like DNA-binding protein [Mycoplasma sp. 1012]